MSNIVPLTKTLRKKAAQQKRKHATMCRQGIHKWQVEKERVFDTKQGQLVTVLRCAYCDKTKHKLI